MQSQLTDRFHGEAFLEQNDKPNRDLKEYRLARIRYDGETPKKEYAPVTSQNEQVRKASIDDIERTRLREWYHDHEYAWYPLLTDLANQIEWSQTAQQKGV